MSGRPQYGDLLIRVFQVEAFDNDRRILRIKLHRPADPVGLFTGDEGGAAAAEQIHHHALGALLFLIGYAAAGSASWSDGRRSSWACRNSRWWTASGRRTTYASRWVASHRARARAATVMGCVPTPGSSSPRYIHRKYESRTPESRRKFSLRYLHGRCTRCRPRPYAPPCFLNAASRNEKNCSSAILSF